MSAFATLTDLEARLGSTIADADQARAQALLDSASTRIRAYTKQQFDEVTDDTIVVRGFAGEIRLPQRPVTAVTAVVAIGSYGAPDFPLVDWKWDEVDIIKDRCITMAVRTLTNPAMAGGLSSETVGPYSYRLDGSGTGLSVELTADDKLDLDTFRAKNSTSQVR